MGIVPQSVWRWKVAAYLFFAGTGGGAILVGVLGDFLGYRFPAKVAVAFGAAAIAFSTLFLILDLGRPEKFLRAMRHPSTSWISRGFFILSAAVLSGGLVVFLWAWPLGGHWASLPRLREAAEAAAFLFALATCIYTGVLLGIVISRPFWNNPLLPVLFLISAISTGIGGIFLVAPLACSALGFAGHETSQFLARLESWDILLVLAEAVAVYLYFALVFDRAPDAAALLLKGRLAGLFWGGFLGAGLLIPVVIEISASVMHADASPWLSPAVAGIFLLVGGFLMRLLILAAGIRSPLVVRAAFRVRPGS